MIHVLTICIGLTWGMCHQLMIYEVSSLAECQKEREYQKENIKNYAWGKCELKKGATHDRPT
jgi:hypothetical protein